MRTSAVIIHMTTVNRLQLRSKCFYTLPAPSHDEKKWQTFSCCPVKIQSDEPVGAEFTNERAAAKRRCSVLCLWIFSLVLKNLRDLDDKCCSNCRGSYFGKWNRGWAALFYFVIWFCSLAGSALDVYLCKSAARGKRKKEKKSGWLKDTTENFLILSEEEGKKKLLSNYCLFNWVMNYL